MNYSSTTSRRRFALFAWTVLAYNILVILWGAYVRASFSGDGCGAHWPLCNGQVIPSNMAAPMAIEFTHRIMTSVDSFAMIAMCVWAFLAFPRRHGVRLYSVLSLVFLFVEALLGAGLVLFRYVAKDESAGRVWYLSGHLTNTMLLLAALTIAAWLAQTNAERPRLGNASRAAIGALVVSVIVSITGVVAALGDTLFPATSLTAGMQQDFSNASNMLLRLRMVHPLIAMLGAAYLIGLASRVLRRDSDSDARPAATRVLTITLFQLMAGAVNLSLLAPVWMQISHLFLADVLWIAVVVLVLELAAVRKIEPALTYA
jgi:cytochrome c oxidase assembly protein subunit 15